MSRASETIPAGHNEAFDGGIPDGICGYRWVTRDSIGTGTIHYCGRPLGAGHLDGDGNSDWHRCACGTPC